MEKVLKEILSKLTSELSTVNEHGVICPAITIDARYILANDNVNYLKKWVIYINQHDVMMGESPEMLKSMIDEHKDFDWMRH